MAHHRYRHARALLEKYQKFSPLIGVLGHRQVGKTTLCGEVADLYYSLDDEESIAYLCDSASDFLREIRGPGLIALDEAQLMPSLFPALKEWVRKHPRPGQFLLTGSIRFTSQRAIRESLTGRIVNLELLPLSLNELHEEVPAESLLRLHQTSGFAVRDENCEFSSALSFRKRMKLLEHYSKTGGLPGLCFVREPSLRNSRIRTQFETILDRDLRMLYPTKLALGELRVLLKFIAEHQGEPFRVSKVQKLLKISPRTIQALLHAIENLFLIRSISIEGDLKGTAYFLEDLAESQYLVPMEFANLNLREQICFQLIRAGLAYRAGVEPIFFQFRTRGGSVVPLAVRLSGQTTGWIPIRETGPDRRENAAARAFLSRYPNSKIVFVRFDIPGSEVLDSKRIIVSVAELTV